MPAAPSTNPAPPDAKATLIDFAQTPCTNYAKPPHYALIIDNAFTREECADLIRIAESTPGASWEPALINSVGPNGTLVQRLSTGTRDSGRIMRDDTDLAEWMYQRVLPFLEDEIKVIEQGKGKWPTLFYEYGTAASGEQWKMKRLNERLRFLRYEEAQYFKTHCDGTYVTPDHLERSFLTFQLYLADSDGELQGGSTRFFGIDERRTRGEFDVAAKTGRVLIFQHNEMYHSGEPIVSGEKFAVRTDFMYA